MRTQQRFVGQCNVITDIKEAVFVGHEDAVVACGSDQGRVFLFDSMTGKLLRVLWADREVANCVQCHPTLPVLATSGMEDVVRTSPLSDRRVQPSGTDGPAAGRSRCLGLRLYVIPTSSAITRPDVVCLCLRQHEQGSSTVVLSHASGLSLPCPPYSPTNRATMYPFQPWLRIPYGRAHIECCLRGGRCGVPGGRAHARAWGTLVCEAVDVFLVPWHCGL